MEEATASTHRFRGAVSDLAGVAGLAGLGLGIDEIVKKGQDWQLQQSRLAQAAKTAHLEVGKTVETLNKSAEATSQVGGFDAPAQAGAMAQFLRITGSTTKAIQANSAAMNFARGSGLSYRQAQLLVGQALTGNVGRLQRYIGIIQPVKTAEYQLAQAHKINIIALEAQAKTLGKAGPQWLKQQELLAGITPKMLQHAQLTDKQATALKAITAIQDKYGGSLDKFSKSTAGAISNAKNVLDLAAEKLGAEALPVVAKIATTIAAAVKYLADHKDVFKIVAIAFGGLLGALVFTKAVEGVQALKAAFTTFGKTIGIVTVATEGATGAEVGATAGAIAWGAAFKATGIGLVITGIIIGLYELVTHFTQVKAVALDAWQWITAAARNAANFVSTRWQGILKWFAIAWQDTSKFVTKVWDNVANGIVKSINWVIAAIDKFIKGYNKVFGWLTGNIGSIGKIGLVGQQPQKQKQPVRGRMFPGTGAGAAKNNSVPAPGTTNAGSDQNPLGITLFHTTNLNGRPIAEETAHFVRKVNALAGAPAAALSGR